MYVGRLFDISRLDFSAPFYLNRCVPAQDKASSPIGGGSEHDEAVVFATTHWSVVITAQANRRRGQSAGKSLPCQQVASLRLRPASGLQPRGSARFDAGFFAMLLERRDLDAVDREKGHWFSYRIAALKNCLVKARHRAYDDQSRKGPALVAWMTVRAGSRRSGIIRYTPAEPSITALSLHAVGTGADALGAEYRGAVALHSTRR